MNEAMHEETNLLLRLLIKVVLQAACFYSITFPQRDERLIELEEIPHYRADAS